MALRRKRVVEAFKQQSIKSYCTGTAVLHEDGRGSIQHATKSCKCNVMRDDRDQFERQQNARGTEQCGRRAGKYKRITGKEG